jgi:hypothetical protein
MLIVVMLDVVVLCVVAPFVLGFAKVNKLQFYFSSLKRPNHRKCGKQKNEKLQKTNN